MARLGCWVVLLWAGVAEAGPAEDARAKELFVQGSAAYERADYVTAARRFAEAYQLSARPDLLYNLAQCYEKVGRRTEAISAYRAYLEAKPDAADRAVIELQIQQLERLQPRAAVADSGPKPLVKRPWFWGVIGAATVVAVTVIAVSAGYGTRERDPTPTFGTVQGP